MQDRRVQAARGYAGVGLRTKNDNRDLSAGEVLLVFDTLIHREKNVEFGCLSGLEKIAVLKSCQSSIAGC
jgi:hypothetical protein